MMDAFDDGGTSLMTKAAHLAILLLACFAVPAGAHGIDCGKPGTRLDAVICDDPEMRDYDRRIAAAYGRGLAIWKGAIASYVRRDQQEWLIAFRTIETLETEIENICALGDLNCIRVELRRRVVDLESEAYVYSGVYRASNGLKLLIHPRYAGDFRVRVYDPARLAKANIVTLEGADSTSWDDSTTMASAMGDANGQALSAGDGCTLRLRAEALSVAVVQTGSCGGQSYAGVYGRLVGETLRGYDLGLH